MIDTVVRIFNIDHFPLRNWDEAWYAEIIKNMASGDYSLLAPYWNGQYYYDKPPLYFWLTLPFFKIFGPGEWQARIISIVATILASVFVYLLSKRFFDKRVAILSVVVFLTMGQIIVRFAYGNLDALVVCLSLATIYFYISNKKVFWTGVSLALVYLVKGWILGLLPILVILIYDYFLLSKNLKRVFLVIAISIFLVSPYYILGFLRFGEQFIDWYLFNPTASLFAYNNFSWQFFGNLVRDVGFWFVPFGLGLALAFRTLGNGYGKLFTLAFSSVVFLLGISFLAGKLGWYALPVYPFVAIIVAYFVEKLMSKKFVLAGILIVIVFILQIYNVDRIENIHPDRSWVGATLGKVAYEIVPKEDLLILDDRDLPAFLFYSNHREVLVVSGSSSQSWEWWIYKYEDLPKLLAQNKDTWIVTRNPILFVNAAVVREVEGYHFLKYTF